MAKLPPGITPWTPHPITGRPRYLVRWRTPQNEPRKKVFDKLDGNGGAKPHLAAVTAAKNAGTYIDPALGRQLFGVFADEWAAAQDQWKASSADQWLVVRRRLDSIIGLPLASFDQLVVQRLRAELARKYAPATVRVTMTYVTAILRAAHAAGRIVRDPTVGVRQKKVRADERGDRVGPEQVPTRAEALGILTATASQWRAAHALGLAGLRIGEVLGMTVDRLDLGDRLVTVDRQLWRRRLTTPKNETVRTIKVPGLVAVELRRHLRERGDLPPVAVLDDDGEAVLVDLLFRGPSNGEALGANRFYEAAWYPALEAAGTPRRFVFHSLRHHCASTLLAEGAPITAVAGYLGDKVETVARTYAHWLRDDRDVPVEILDRVLAPLARHEEVEAAL